ncbi:hypothetical protein Poly30_31830 [Planctomycetes bacterium Poly30]|uniref:Uncharacterized protein n=1 Tax=Saltatorellus ferox TaxID=2528018 RepID=A0A518EU83_9BACT|nr:hypothetical protein Poly30_31830 [Planctomycetes bacterium Poly30]
MFFCEADRAAPARSQNYLPVEESERYNLWDASRGLLLDGAVPQVPPGSDP